MIRAAILLAMICATLAAADGKFVQIPAGRFIMGCDPVHACPEHQPPREVVFDAPFWLHHSEVTVAEFRRFVDATGHETIAEQRDQARTWSNPGSFSLAGELPVTYVALPDAEAYCQWIGARLPTEDEWTYAFRAGETMTGRLWWNTDGRYVWYRENSDARPHPVGSKLPNAWGLHDMEGNVWEWMRNGDSQDYPGAIRGGSWVSCPRIEPAPAPPKPGPPPPHSPFSRCLSSGTAHIRDDIGFRCARSR